MRDVRIPVFGDISAGKTRFLYASLNSLMQTAQRAGLDVSFPDQTSRELAEFGLNVIRSGRETAKTSTNAQVTLTCRLGTGRGSELVHLFDAAGEHFRNARRPDALRFLDDGQGLVYVLDPFSVEAIRRQVADRDPAAMGLAHAAAGDPELTYDEVVSRLRDSGVPASRELLAVVVSKADLLRSAGLQPPTELSRHRAVATRLRGAQPGHLRAPRVRGGRGSSRSRRSTSAARQPRRSGGPAALAADRAWRPAAGRSGRSGRTRPAARTRAAPAGPSHRHRKQVPSEPAEARP